MWYDQADGMLLDKIYFTFRFSWTKHETPNCLWLVNPYGVQVAPFEADSRYKEIKLKQIYSPLPDGEDPVSVAKSVKAQCGQ